MEVTSHTKRQRFKKRLPGRVDDRSEIRPNHFGLGGWDSVCAGLSLCPNHSCEQSQWEEWKVSLHPFTAKAGIWQDHLSNMNINPNPFFLLQILPVASSGSDPAAHASKGYRTKPWGATSYHVHCPDKTTHESYKRIRSHILHAAQRPSLLLQEDSTAPCYAYLPPLQRAQFTVLIDAQIPVKDTTLERANVLYGSTKTSKSREYVQREGGAVPVHDWKNTQAPGLVRSI